jgi:hypothetical protein
VVWARDPSDAATGASALADPGANVRLVIKGGLIAAAPGGPGAHAFAAANMQLAAAAAAAAAGGNSSSGPSS